MSNLTKFQDKLISELKGEFERINPREAESTNKRFSLATINKCINEEDNFMESIYSYNKKVIAKLKKQFFDELKKLTKLMISWMKLFRRMYQQKLKHIQR